MFLPGVLFLLFLLRFVTCVFTEDTCHEGLGEEVAFKLIEEYDKEARVCEELKGTRAAGCSRSRTDIL